MTYYSIKYWETRSIEAFEDADVRILSDNIVYVKDLYVPHKLYDDIFTDRRAAVVSLEHKRFKLIEQLKTKIRKLEAITF